MVDRAAPSWEVQTKTPAEFEGYAHRAPSIVFVSHRDPEHGHKALAHHRMEAPPILAHYIPGPGMEFQQQAVQGIEINTRSLGQCCGHRTAEHRDRLPLGLASRRRSRSSTATVAATPAGVVACAIPPSPDAAPVGSKFRKKMRTISPKPMVRISR